MAKNNRAIVLSLIITTAFAVALLLLTFGAAWIVPYICGVFSRMRLVKFLITVTYFAVPAGWGAIYCLYQILINLKKGKVFEKQNIKVLSFLSILCFYVGILSAVAAFTFILFWLVSFAALFIGLIVRVVMNILNSAIELKEENDMTI